MDGVVYSITAAQFEEMIEPRYHNQVVLSAVNLSIEILVGMYGGQPLCYIGLAPRTLISSEVYAWMIVTEVGEKHPFILARHANAVLDRILSQYSRVFGHCFEPRSVKWLKALGAEFTSATEFEFRR